MKEQVLVWVLMVASAVAMSAVVWRVQDNLAAGMTADEAIVRVFEVK